jgi:hypothetical protein
VLSCNVYSIEMHVDARQGVTKLSGKYVLSDIELISMQHTFPSIFRHTGG